MKWYYTIIQNDSIMTNIIISTKQNINLNLIFCYVAIVSVQADMSYLEKKNTFYWFLELSDYGLAIYILPSYSNQVWHDRPHEIWDSCHVKGPWAIFLHAVERHDVTWPIRDICIQNKALVIEILQKATIMPLPSYSSTKTTQWKIGLNRCCQGVIEKIRKFK